MSFSIMTSLPLDVKKHTTLLKVCSMLKNIPITNKMDDHH